MKLKYANIYKVFKRKLKKESKQWEFKPLLEALKAACYTNAIFIFYMVLNKI